MLDRLSCAARFGWGGWPRGMWPPVNWGGWPPAMWPALPWGSATPCFADGTRILTVRGEIPVERLKAGHIVITVRDDGPETARVVWTARHDVDVAGHPEPEQLRPIRILAGAFEPGMPDRDLRVSPHQALYLGGVLIEALDLVNGTTLIQEPATTMTYNAIELEQHDVMLAEGLPVASFLDSGGHDIFADRRTILLHPAFTGGAGAEPCAKLAPAGERLAAARARLQARAAELG
jgi:hypothetical protein